MRRARLYAALVAAVALVATSASWAAADISMVIYKQEKSNWCWVAASKMVIVKLTGKNPTQCDIYKVAKSSASCSANSTGTITSDVGRIFATYGLTSQISYMPPTVSQLQSEIGRGRPVLVRYGYKPSLSAGHMVVAKGYTYDAAAKAYRISWADPALGKTVVGAFAYFSNNTVWKTTHSRIWIQKP